MTHFDYITKHLLPSWARQWSCNFKIWGDLVTGNCEDYANPWGESPERECYEWFWSAINMDDTYSKDYLEFLVRLAEEVKEGKVKTYPAKEVLERLRQAVEDCNDQEV